MKLSEKQCALLCGFMYLEQSVQNDTIVGDILDKIKNEKGQFDPNKLEPTGGITKEEAVTLLEEIERDPKLCGLKVVQSVDTGIRATCFIDTKSKDQKDALVAFRGTGGITRAWEDNFVGAYETTTAMQQEAVDFVRDKCGKYMISQTTGHSKGGNLAEHVTIASGRVIDDCVAFDAQGFNSSYLEANKAQIEKNAGKIRSIYADKDFVSPLLNPVASKENTKCIKIGDVKSFGDSHKITMLEQNNLFDDNGQYKPDVMGSRTMIPKQINKVTRALDKSGFLTSKPGKNITDLLAVDVSARMTKEPERQIALKPASKERELKAIKSGVFHVNKSAKEESADRIKAEKKDMARKRNITKTVSNSQKKATGIKRNTAQSQTRGQSRSQIQNQNQSQSQSQSIKKSLSI